MLISLMGDDDYTGICSNSWFLHNQLLKIFIQKLLMNPWKDAILCFLLWFLDLLHIWGPHVKMFCACASTELSKVGADSKFPTILAYV